VNYKNHFLSIVNYFLRCYIDNMTAKDIAHHVKISSLRWTSHILERLFQRNIRINDVKEALLNGEIIEQYPIILFPVV